MRTVGRGSGRRSTLRVLTATALGAAAAAAIATAVPASAAPAAPVPVAPVPVAPVPAATVHPGVMTHTAGGGQCTANFVFRAGAKAYLGQAAHCSGTGEPTETDGCTSRSLPLGTPVEVDGAPAPGRLVYNSWLAMQAAGEQDPDACRYNDFALVELPAGTTVDPSVPFFGGPTGIDRDGTAPGDRVLSYGNSGLRGGVALLSPKQGISIGDTGRGWSHTVTTLTPGIPGDSGSAFLSADGTALGLLSTLNIAPEVGTNGVSDLARVLGYAQTHGAPGGIGLVTGGPFSTGVL